MVFMFSDEYENILNAAAKIDEQINDEWQELVADQEYQTLFEFFDPENYSRHDEYDDWIEVNTDKLLKKILTGKDRIALIRYAFMLGQLVGQAAQICRDHEDD